MNVNALLAEEKKEIVGHLLKTLLLELKIKSSFTDLEARSELKKLLDEPK